MKKPAMNLQEAARAVCREPEFFESINSIVEGGRKLHKLDITHGQVDRKKLWDAQREIVLLAVSKSHSWLHAQPGLALKHDELHGPDPAPMAGYWRDLDALLRLRRTLEISNQMPKGKKQKKRALPHLARSLLGTLVFFNLPYPPLSISNDVVLLLCQMAEAADVSKSFTADNAIKALNSAMTEMEKSSKKKP